MGMPSSNAKMIRIPAGIRRHQGIARSQKKEKKWRVEIKTLVRGATEAQVTRLYPMQRPGSSTRCAPRDGGRCSSSPLATLRRNNHRSHRGETRN